MRQDENEKDDMIYSASYNPRALNQINESRQCESANLPRPSVRPSLVHDLDLVHRSSAFATFLATRIAFPSFSFFFFIAAAVIETPLLHIVVRDRSETLLQMQQAMQSNEHLLLDNVHRFAADMMDVDTEVEKGFNNLILVMSCSANGTL